MFRLRACKIQDGAYEIADNLRIVVSHPSHIKFAIFPSPRNNRQNIVLKR